MYPTIDMKATGIYLRQLMDKRKITVKDIQKYLNLSSVQSVYHWLNGHSMPTIDHLYALAEFFQMPMDAMIIGNRKNSVSEHKKRFQSRMLLYYGTLKPLYMN